MPHDPLPPWSGGSPTARTQAEKIRALVNARIFAEPGRAASNGSTDDEVAAALDLLAALDEVMRTHLDPGWWIDLRVDDALRAVRAVAATKAGARAEGTGQ